MISKNHNIWIVVFALAAILAFSSLILTKELSFIFIALISLIIFILTLIDPKIGLYLTCFSIAVSPEFVVQTQDVGILYLRLEDFIITIMFLSWIFRVCVRREFLIRSYIFIPIICLVLVNLFSVIHGVWVDFIGFRSFLEFFKRFQYIILFLLVLNNLRTLNDAKTLLNILLFSGACLSIYGLYKFVFTAPEGVLMMGPKREGYNITGGCLLWHISMAISMLGAAKRSLHKVLMAMFLMLLSLGFFYTGSRTTYVSIIPILILFGIFRGWKFSIAVLFIIIGGLFLIPQIAIDRLLTIPGLLSTSSFDPIVLNPVTVRILGWKMGWIIAGNHPLLGAGLGYTNFSLFESEFPMRVAFTGFTGLLIFLWMLVSIGRLAKRVAFRSKDEFISIVGFGYLAGFFGFLVHALAAPSFSAIRSAETFWVFTAIIVFFDVYIRYVKK